MPTASVVELPSRFQEHRVFVCPVTTGADTLCFYTDTGGGTNMLYAPTATRLSVPLEHRTFGGDSVMVADWPTWQEGAGVPSPIDTSGPVGGQLMAVPLREEMTVLHDTTDAGFLGRTWWAERVWTIDYPGKRLFVRPTGELPTHEPDQVVPLGFQTDSGGARTTHFPRVRAAVDGDTLDMLFDTGATMMLRDSARTVMDDDRPSRRAASFISASVFDRWRSEHPNWRVIAAATSFRADIIEVPAVEIAGQVVGPVWFERRREGTFEEYMSRWMDQPIVGALGGNVLGFFRVTIDYPNAIAILQRQE